MREVAPTRAGRALVSVTSIGVAFALLTICCGQVPETVASPAPTEVTRPAPEERATPPVSAGLAHSILEPDFA